MTTPTAPTHRVQHWYTRPAIALPVIAALVILAALSRSTDVSGRAGDPRLSASSSAPQGARLFSELAQRTGWQVERWEQIGIPAEPNIILAVLNPARPLRLTEAHDLLNYVRAGGALYLVMPAGGGITDSLHLGWVGGGVGGSVVADSTTDRDSCPVRHTFFVPLWPDSTAHLYGLQWTAPRPDGDTTFVSVSIRADKNAEFRARPAMIGFALGKGKIVVGSDPDLLRNDVLRACANGLDVPAVRALEYLSSGGPARRRTLVFDEYHQGFGAQPGTMQAIGGFLFSTAPGRTLLQLIAAGLLLLFASAPRAIAPRDAARIERRSPLEHVDALARAYAQVGATRTATARLLRGVRRRADVGDARAAAALSDDAFLARAEQHAPAIHDDVALIRRALKEKVSRQTFPAVGDAVYRLETTLTRI